MSVPPDVFHAARLSLPLEHEINQIADSIPLDTSLGYRMADSVQPDRLLAVIPREVTTPLHQLELGVKTKVRLSFFLFSSQKRTLTSNIFERSPPFLQIWEERQTSPFTPSETSISHTASDKCAIVGGRMGRYVQTRAAAI